jgi:hypothetical protein
MTLHRRILRSLSMADDPSLRRICRRAAHARLTSATDFVSALRPEHLQSFWYAASKYNFALIGTFIALLWATATERDEADMYKRCLDEYKWVLRLSSKSAEFLELAIARMSGAAGVLVRGIPEVPDVQRILGRVLRGRGNGLDSRGPGVVDREEEDMCGDTSPGNVVGDTPSDTDLLAGVWNVDQAWFSALGEVGGGFEEGHSGTDMSRADLDLSIAQVEFDQGQYI